MPARRSAPAAGLAGFVAVIAAFSCVVVTPSWAAIFASVALDIGPPP